MLQHEFLTIPEVATLLKVHEITVRRMLKSKRLSAYRVGKVYRFRREEIDAYLRSVHEKAFEEEQPIVQNNAAWLDELEMITLPKGVSTSFSREEIITERGF